MTAFAPTSESEVAECVADCAARKAPLEILGGGSKREWGRPVEAAQSLSLAGLSGIVDYDPEEMTITALAGTELYKIEARLAAFVQCLAFEPYDYGKMFRKPSRQTIGGIVATNLSGSWRPWRGAARDHVLGFRAVNGRGEIFKAGGKVMKNVTGYDLPKLLAGSFGTLAILTEVTLKTYPLQHSDSLLLFDRDAREAERIMLSPILDSASPTGIAYLPANLSDRYPGGVGKGLVILRCDGPQDRVYARFDHWQKAFGDPVGFAMGPSSNDLWRDLNEVRYYFPYDDSVFWRFTIPRSRGFAVAEALEKLTPDTRWYMDWGGGRIYWDQPPDFACDLDAFSNLLSAGGHCELLRGPLELRRKLRPIGDLIPASLLAGIKQAFDPAGILNPGRLYPEF